MPPVTAAIVLQHRTHPQPTWCFLFLGEFPGVLSIIGALIVLTAVTAYTILSLPRASRSLSARQSADKAHNRKIALIKENQWHFLLPCGGFAEPFGIVKSSRKV